MKIQYKKKTQRVNLFLGISWLVFGIIMVIVWEISEEKRFNYMSIGYFVMSFLYFLLYYRISSVGYLRIKNGFISNDSIFSKKKLKLSEIKQIKKFAGDYILKTDDKEMTINTQIIEPKSLEKLNAELGKLNVSWL